MVGSGSRCVSRAPQTNVARSQERPSDLPVRSSNPHSARQVLQVLPVLGCGYPTSDLREGADELCSLGERELLQSKREVLLLLDSGPDLEDGVVGELEEQGKVTNDLDKLGGHGDMESAAA